MSKFLFKMMALFAVLIAMPTTAAMAQATRTWVSGVGDDANPCSRTAPCKTWAGAISKTAAGGEINALDDGAYGAVTITKSITLRSVGKTAGVLHSSTNGVVINAAATDRVILDGLDINGAPPTSPGLNGIRILAARDVIVMNSLIQNSRGAAPNGSGILIEGSGQIRVTVENVQFVGNIVGITVKTAAPGSGSVKVNNSLFIANTDASIRVTGANNSASIYGNKFYGSPKALEILAGATVSSFGNNAIGTAGTDPISSLTPTQ